MAAAYALPPGVSTGQAVAGLAGAGTSVLLRRRAVVSEAALARPLLRRRHRNQEDQSRGRSYLILANADLPRGLVLLRMRRYCAAVSLSPGRSA